MGSNKKMVFDDLCVGDILFVESKGKGGVFNVIGQKILTNLRLKEEFNYTHVILSLGKGLFIESNLDNGVSILTCLDLASKINISYKNNYKIFRNKIVANNKEMKRKIFMRGEYYYGQEYNKLFLLQKNRKGHAYCSQLIYNIYRDALNLELKAKSILKDVFPIHIWDILKANNEWYEVTSNLRFVLERITEYKEKYQLDFIEDQTFKILNKEIVIEDLNARKNIFDTYLVLISYRNFMLFLKGVYFKSSLPFSLNIDTRETYYDRLFDFEFLVSRLDEITKPSMIDTGIDFSCKGSFSNGNIPISPFMQVIDNNIMSVAQSYSDKSILLNMSDEDIQVSFRDKTVIEKIIEVDKAKNLNTKFIYMQYNRVLVVNTYLCMALQSLSHFHLLENTSEIKLETEKNIKELLLIYVWEIKRLDEIVNSEQLNDCWNECKNEGFSSQIEILIDCRRVILTCYAEIVAKIRIMAEYLKINSIEHSLSVKESIEIYLTIDGVCQKDDFLYLMDKLGYFESEKEQT